MTDSRPKVMVVDDEAENVEYVRRALRRSYDVHFAATGEEGLSLIERHHFAIVLSDLRMPGMSGVSFLTRAFEISPETVRIVLTGYADVDNTIDAINLSHVSGFLRKPVRPAEIEQVVNSGMEVYALRAGNRALIRKLEERNRLLEEKENLLQLSLDEKSRELLRINRHLEEMVVRDGLTGLYNHRYFQERAEQEVGRARRYELNLSLVFFDLDFFKSYNDVNGHPEGDRALVGIADILKNQSRIPDVVTRVRGTDVVARYGGEEFVVLLPETPQNGARIMAERLRDFVARHPFPGEEQLPGGRLTISAGVASFPTDATDRAALIEKADAALYRAKSSGRNRVCVWGTTD